MASLIIMAVYDTEENGRSGYTEKTLESLLMTVDWRKHRLIIVDNGSCERTKKLLKDCILAAILTETRDVSNFIKPIIITNETNLGTARAINQGLKLRNPGEYCIKCDNDVVIHQSGWVEEMEAVIERDATIGIVGLKRKDVEWDGQYIALPHVSGQRWLTVEKGTYIMGTCTMFNPKLIDTIGYSWQPKEYGLEDTLYALRSELAGFWNCYLPHIDISHIDTGANPYTQEKHQIAKESWPEYMAAHQGYIDGTKSLYYDGGLSE